MSRLDFILDSSRSSKLPKSLEECIAILNKLQPEWVERIKQASEEEVIGELHFNTGQALRNEWKLWDKTSALHKHFKELGLWHADDMSSVILTSWHRYMNKKPIQIEKQVKFYQKHWKKNGYAKGYPDE